MIIIDFVIIFVCHDCVTCTCPFTFTLQVWFISSPPLKKSGLSLFLIRQAALNTKIPMSLSICCHGETSSQTSESEQCFFQCCIKCGRINWNLPPKFLEKWIMRSIEFQMICSIWETVFDLCMENSSTHLTCLKRLQNSGTGAVNILKANQAHMQT